MRIFQNHPFQRPETNTERQGVGGFRASVFPRSFSSSLLLFSYHSPLPFYSPPPPPITRPPNLPLHHTYCSPTPPMVPRSCQLGQPRDVLVFKSLVTVFRQFDCVWVVRICAVSIVRRQQSIISSHSEFSQGKTNLPLILPNSQHP